MLFVTRARQGSAKPAPTHTDSAGFLMILRVTSWVLEFFLRGGAGCGCTNFFYADTRPALPHTRVTNIPKKYPNLSHFLNTLKPLHSPAAHDTLRFSDLSSSHLSISLRLSSLLHLTDAAPPQSRSTDLAVAPRFLSHLSLSLSLFGKIFSGFSCSDFCFVGLS